MRIAIISGASSGIGKSIARELDLLGLDELWLIGRREDKLSILASELTSKARCLTFDLNDANVFDRIKLILEVENSRIEYLVNSAGVGFNKDFAALSPDEVSQMVDLNCKALTLLTSVAVPYFKNGSKIINIASGAGFLPQPGFSVYASTKAYVISFSRALRHELKKKKVNVTAVCPGPVDTNFFAKLENVKAYKKKYLVSPEKVARGAIKAANKNKAVYTPTISIKLVHLISKILPTSLVLKFMK